MPNERMLDKSKIPADDDLLQWIDQPELAAAWSELRRFLAETYLVTPIFDSGGKRYGWNLKYKIGSRPLCELYPEKGSFTVLVILGKLEIAAAMARIETFHPTVRSAVETTPRFHDGCWMYIRLENPASCLEDVADLKELILIKRKLPRRS